MEDNDFYLEHKLPPISQRRLIDYFLYIPRSLKMYSKRMIHIFTLKFILFLGTTQFLLKGIVYTMSNVVMLPLFKHKGVNALDLQIYTALATAPWTIKPLFGILSDLVTIKGYHKRFWLLQSYLWGILGSISLLFISDASILVLSFLAINYQLAISDLLSEGKYAELMRDNPRSGSDMVTLVSGFQMFGSIIAMSVVGPLSDLKSFFPLFIIMIALSLSPIIPTLLGWLPEKKSNDKLCFINVDRDRFRREKKLYLVVFFVGITGPILAFVSVYLSTTIGLLLSGLFLIFFSLASFAVFPTLIAKVTLYQILSRISRPSISSALDYFYTADAICLPNGPHFSFKYYITFTGILGAVFSFLTVFLYQAWLKHWKFRNVLIFTTILIAFAGIFDIIIVKRLNLVLGISDKTFYILGEAIVESVVNMLYWIPSSAIISKACKVGLESTTYSYIAGLNNFALLASSLLGAVIFNAAGIKTTGGENCNFDALWWLILLFHIILPVLIGIPAAWLIPNLSQHEDLTNENNLNFQRLGVEEVIELE